MPEIKGFEKKIRGNGTGRHPFILIEKERFLLTPIVNFIKAVRDPFIQQQVDAVIRYILEFIVRAPSIEDFIHGPSFLEPKIILNLLNLSEEIRNDPNDFRCNAYIKTVFNAIVDWLEPQYPY